MAAASGAAQQGTGVGMLRDWTFQATLEHRDARIRLRLIPQWVSGNLDADEVQAAPDPARRYTAIKPFFTFRDMTASALAGDDWEEVEKTVVLYRGRLQPPRAKLRDWCKRCLQLVLSDERTVTVDGSPHLRRVKIGDKCHRSPWTIGGGHKTLTFDFTRHDRSAAVTESHGIAVGALVRGVGYLILVTCRRQEELATYVRDSLMPAFETAAQCALDVDVDYPETAHEKLRVQQQNFGLLRYFDRSAAVEFTLPMHPMHIRPDHSPLQSAGFGSLACLTLDLDVFQKLYDDDMSGPSSATQPGANSARYKANSVVLYVEVEDVVKLGFPSVMSVDQYAAFKTKKLLETFRDARIVGTPLSLPLGQRAGRSTTCTFSYEMDDHNPSTATSLANRGTNAGGANARQTVVVKALVVTTLVGNHGATVVFFTRMGQAIFDTHIFIFHHLLRTLRFYTERDLVGQFSKDDAARIRLTDQDLPRAYATGGDRAKPMLQKHLAALQASTDGEVDGATVVVVRPEDSDPMLRGDDPTTSVRPGAQQMRVVVADPEENSADEADGEPQDDASVVSVREIQHLQAGLEDEAMLLDDDPEVSADDEPNSPMERSESQGPQTSTPSAAAAHPTNGNRHHPSATPMDEQQRDDGSDPATPREGESAAAFGALPATEDSKGGTASPTRRAEEEEEEEVRALVQEALRNDGPDSAATARGPSLRSTYRTICEEESTRPNSYLIQRLPEDPRFTHGIQELDMSFNYVGHAGFRAILRLARYLPQLRTAHFNAMSLDNEDVAALCRCMAENKTVRAIHIRNNARITLPASPQLLRLLRINRRITVLTVSGSSLGADLIAKIETTAKGNVSAIPATTALRSGSPQATRSSAVQPPSPTSPDGGSDDAFTHNRPDVAPTAQE